MENSCPVLQTLKVKLTEAESRLVQESSTQRAEGEVRVIVNRLAEDEDQLRRTENYAGGQGRVHQSSLSFFKSDFGRICERICH